MSDTPCLICAKNLAQDGYVAGTVFTAHGNYGSTLFDPVTDDTVSLQLALCADCLVAHAHLVRQVTITRRAPEFTHAAWDPADGQAWY